MPRWELRPGEKHVAEKERRLRANDRAFNLQFDYAKNSIKTSKYNFFTFLPLNLFEQFRRIANAYFLFLLILQLIPAISSLSWFTTVVPLVLVLAVSAAKDAIDDVNRHKNDKQVNNRPVQVLANGSLKEDRWLNVEVGDIIKLENNNFVTADLLLLSSSEPHSLTYIETAELDGETNLKVKQALTVTSELGEDLQALSSFDGTGVSFSPSAAGPRETVPSWMRLPWASPFQLPPFSSPCSPEEPVLLAYIGRKKILVPSEARGPFVGPRGAVGAFLFRGILGNFLAAFFPDPWAASASVPR